MYIYMCVCVGVVLKGCVRVLIAKAARVHHETLRSFFELATVTFFLGEGFSETEQYETLAKDK